MRDHAIKQIYRVDGKNSFVEVLADALNIDKFQINFVQYDESTHKQTASLPMYVNALSLVALAERILNGEFNREIKAAQKDGTYQGKQVNDYTSFFTVMGGIKESVVEAHFDDMKKRYPFIQKGMAISRQLKIQRGQKYPYVLRVEYNTGKSDDKGLIVPSSGKAQMAVSIPLTYDNANEFATAIKYAYQAYLTQYYTIFRKTLFGVQEAMYYDEQSNKNVVVTEGQK